MFDTTGAALQGHGINPSTFHRNVFLEGRAERRKSKAPNVEKMRQALANGIKLKSWGLASRAAGWLYEDGQLTGNSESTGQVGTIFTVKGRDAAFLAMRIASRYEEWI